MKLYWAEIRNTENTVVGARFYSDKKQAEDFCKVMERQGQEDWSVTTKEHNNTSLSKVGRVLGRRPVRATSRTEGWSGKRIPVRKHNISSNGRKAYGRKVQA